MFFSGLNADLYKLPETSYGDAEKNPENKCYDTKDYSALKGLQNISPCQYGAPVYLSNPHFYQADPQLLETVEGLSPNPAEHETYFKIQPVREEYIIYFKTIMELFFVFLLETRCPPGG